MSFTRSANWPSLGGVRLVVVMGSIILALAGCSKPEPPALPGTAKAAVEKYYRDNIVTWPFEAFVPTVQVRGPWVLVRIAVSPQTADGLRNQRPDLRSGILALTCPRALNEVWKHFGDRRTDIIIVADYLNEEIDRASCKVMGEGIHEMFRRS